jgi:hypothetical protein
MRLFWSTTFLLIALTLSRWSSAQEAGVVHAAYEKLPASESHLTIIPPASPTEATVPVASVVVPMEDSLVTTQAWTPGGVTCGQGVGTTHSLCSEPWNGGWFGAVELTALQPSYTRGGMTLDEDRAFVGPRLVFGWEGDRGLGVRTRFWGLENESDLLTDMGGPFDVRLLTSRFDVDLYRKFAFHGSHVTVGASVTGAHLEAEFDSTLLVEENGAGVGFFVEGRHLFYQSDAVEWAVISRGRWAGLVGEWEDGSRIGLTRGDANSGIFEAALGVEFKRNFDCTDLIVQYMIEGQSWDATYVGDIGYLGSTLSIGFGR